MEQQVKSWKDLRAEGWRKSSFSSGNGGNCVMTRRLPASGSAGMAVGDTKNPGDATLEFGAAQWRRFTESVKRGR